jgi:fatty-acyl-CoA synthase
LTLERPTAKTFGGVLDQMAATRASHPALIYQDTTLSYRELRNQALEVSRALHTIGIRRGDRVGVLLANQTEWVLMCYGCAYLGATMVPLNTWYKQSELRWTLKHCDIRLLAMMPSFLSQNFESMIAALVPEAAGCGPGEIRSHEFPSLHTLITVGGPPSAPNSWNNFLRLASGTSTESLQAQATQVKPQDVMFILYTSGSLAEPKGVLLQHRGAIENGFDMGVRRAIDGNDRVWIGSPLFYGLGATNALPVTLTHGATLVLQGSFEAGRAISVIESTRATTFYGTGNMSRAILDHPDYRQSRIGSLKKGNAGTMPEYKRMTLVEMGIAQACPAYGLTESYGNATVGEADDPIEVKIRTNGRPLPGMDMCIVDPQTYAELERGQIGLVLLRGHTTPGYHANPSETAKALRSDGFFDTGDLGWLDNEGRFIFHARLKEVIKSGGINVSPLEVEQLLIQHPAVRDAHVVGVTDSVRGELIVAFADIGQPVTEKALKEFLKAQAASFKVPHHILFRTEAQLPRLASGKVSKVRLAQEAKNELGS